jgi:hypothetical protein
MTVSVFPSHPLHFSDFDSLSFPQLTYPFLSSQINQRLQNVQRHVKQSRLKHCYHVLDVQELSQILFDLYVGMNGLVAPKNEVMGRWISGQ